MNSNQTKSSKLIIVIWQHRFKIVGTHFGWIAEITMVFEFFGLVFGTKEEVSATIQTLVVAFWVIFEGWTALQDRIQFNRKCLTKTTYFISSQWLKKAHDETIIIQKEIQNYDIVVWPNPAYGRSHWVSMLVTYVGDGLCWYQLWHVGDPFEMLMTDS